MDNKTLDKLLSYLPVIIATCDRYGWDGQGGRHVGQACMVDVKTFFNLIQSDIPLKELPDTEDIFGDPGGGITLLWETELDPVKVIYDSFALTFFGDSLLEYHGQLETIGTDIKGMTSLEEPLDRQIVEHLIFFKNKREQI